jgi:hypothetical protein
MPRPVSTLSHLLLETEIGGYEAADAALESIELVYAALTRVAGCESD